MSPTRTSAVALATGLFIWLLLVGGAQAIAAENAGCPTGSEAWSAHILSFGADVDLNGDDVICAQVVDGLSVWTDNATVNERAGSCPTNGSLELHPGFAADRNGDNYLCFIVTGAAHRKLGKEIYVDNNRKSP